MRSPKDSAQSVSVVIPTTGFRLSLLAAVASVLQEPVAEVIIVANGPRTDADLLRNVASLDLRVRIDATNQVQGCGAARQRGVDTSEGAWIAFLDDDDIWLPGKIQAQLESASSRTRLSVCGSIWLTSRGTKVLPGRAPRRRERLFDYVSVVSSVGGHGLLSPPTLLIEKTLLQDCPWWPRDTPRSADRHEDAQWVARAGRYVDTSAMSLVREPFVVVSRGSDGSFESAAYDAHRRHEQYVAECAWVSQYESLMSEAARRHFTLTNVLPLKPTLAANDWIEVLRSPAAAVVGLHRRRKYFG